MKPKMKETRKSSIPSSKERNVRTERHQKRPPHSSKLRTESYRNRDRGFKKKSRSNPKAILAIGLLFALLVFSVTACSAFGTPKGEGEVIVTIEKGASTSAIGQALEDEGVVKSAGAFTVYSRIFADSKDFQAGSYKIKRPISLKDLCTLLADGSNVMEGVKVTIPEGYVATQIATLLESKGLGSKDRYLELFRDGAFDYEFLQYSKPATVKYKLEGYLYPDTYYFFEDATEEEVIWTLLDEFEVKVWPNLKKAATEQGVSHQSILSLASIIEKEAVEDKERAKIAGVFYNRLDIKMPLQSCATIQYALNREKFATVVTIAETKMDSPYNTYVNAGLTPGPICNPGLESILAAIAPESHDYLYFVAKGDGTHTFSKTYEDHLAAQK